ncbi:TPA: hypothetical protein DEF17_06290 [bacterium]|nr:hypothetical protein [bacterium]
MARLLRVDLQDQWYHVVARGNEKHLIFLDNDDFITYLGYLAEASARFDIRIGSYCLMPNHIHLLLLRGREPLSRHMHTLHTRYSIYFNKKYNRSGHLFQGRYNSFRVSSESYLDNLVRYIHQNPVRAHLSSSPKTWRWSSDQFYRTGDHRLGTEKRVPEFEGSSGAKRYLNLIEEAVPEIEIRLNEHYHGGVERRKNGRSTTQLREFRGRPSMTQVAEECAQRAGIDPTLLKKRIFYRPVVAVRKQAMSILYEYGYNTSAIGRFFGVSPSAVTKARKK